MSTFLNQASEIQSDLAAIRRHIHQEPEIGLDLPKTQAKIIAALDGLGLEVSTGKSLSSVTAVLRGAKSDKTVLLRADMDALPVTELADLSYKSQIDGAMHACGHDLHVAMLIGAAKLLSKNKSQLNGDVVFMFQPGEEGFDGAGHMIKEGVLENPKVEAIFGLHINSQTPVGTIKYKTGGIMASVERFVINVKGKQTHGSQPWSGVDPILISAKIIDGLQTIISREAELTNEAAVITVGKITSGTRFNIIPESSEMIGTVRTLDPRMRKMIEKRMKEMVEGIAEAYGGEASIIFQNNTSITYNDEALTSQILPSLQTAAGKSNVVIMKATTGGEDFSYFQEKVPGVYFFLGGMSPGNKESFPHHTPDFIIDESGLLLGVKAFTQIALDYLN